MIAATNGYAAYNAATALRTWGVWGAAKNDGQAAANPQNTAAAAPDKPNSGAAASSGVAASSGLPPATGPTPAQPTNQAAESSAGGLRAVDDAGSEQTLKRLGLKECETCKSRQYQDGSNDPGVSFKTPTHISPDNAGQAVASHEQEHVTRERSKAQREGRQVVYQSVMIFTAVCPECGRTYVSGGRTVTVTATAAALYDDSASVMDKESGSELDEAV